MMAYKFYMNSIDRFNQVRATSLMIPNANRVSLTLSNFIVDSSIQNAFSFYQTLGKDIFETIFFYDTHRRSANFTIRKYGTNRFF